MPLPLAVAVPIVEHALEFVRRKLLHWWGALDIVHRQSASDTELASFVPNIQALLPEYFRCEFILQY